ncbi:hypothetical protein LWC34_12435 [Kibdelosporangium philippinense]|uniref:Tripartite tricarboxylate transporter TctB family protein n=1 Tax=Kibdelosporangium philippinense TaxID=211113 RepID=A0ABS8Z9B6_9PSEU|nr:hypothetical protein [Kibdelosporangium philippinense]MCE7003628.1 hypothetical protein [Kibdelosporangium philippinense]
MADYRADVDPGFRIARELMKFLMNAALVVAPAFLGGLAIFFVSRAFVAGVGSGFRSLAAIVFPLMVLAFVYAGKKLSHEVERQRKVELPELPTLAEVAIMAVVGGVSMLLLELSTTIPIVELVLATGFSFIVYVLGQGRDRAAPYCLGLVIGSLGYVIIVGVPHF